MRNRRVGGTSRLPEFEDAQLAWSFTYPDLIDHLDSATDATLDGLPYGLIAMQHDGVVTAYNDLESRMAGLSTAKVVGRNFFSEVAPCTNNFMIAGRFQTEPALDDVIDYVFTLRMKATKVRLRLLKARDRPRMYLLVERK